MDSGRKSQRMACQMPRNRWEAKVWNNVNKLLNTKNWHAAATHSSDWRKKTGESMARKWTEETEEEKGGGGGGEGPPLPCHTHKNAVLV